MLPPALDELYLSDTLDRVLCRDDDYLWIRAVPTADWLELFDAVADAAAAARRLRDAGRARHVMLAGLLDAIRTLSCRVCALGLEPRLIHAHMEIEEVDSPFLMQNIEANNYLDDYGRLLAGEADAMEDARHLLVMLDQCEDVVLKIRRGAAGVRHQRRADLPAGGAHARASTACASCCSWSTPAANCRPRRRSTCEALADEATPPAEPPTVACAAPPPSTWPRNWPKRTTPSTRCAAWCATTSTCWRAT